MKRKSCLQTLLGVIYFNETKNLLWWLSNLFVLVGALFYSIVRNKEMNNSKERLQVISDLIEEYF